MECNETKEKKMPTKIEPNIIFNCDNCGIRIATNCTEVECLKCGLVYDIVVVAIPGGGAGKKMI